METLLRKEEQIKMFANQSPCICFNLRKASRAITQVYDRMFKEIQMTSSQMAIINSLKIIGPMNVSELSEAMATDRTTITRNLKPLEREKYIIIQPGKDRRSRKIMLTEKGEEVSAKSFELYKEFQAKLYDSFGEEKVEKLCKDLNEAVEHIQKI